MTNAKKKLPPGYNPEPFPPGYTQADEDRHLRRMRNLQGANVAVKVVFALAGLLLLYMLITGETIVAVPPVSK
jgi:hypothetical protein